FPWGSSCTVRLPGNLSLLFPQERPPTGFGMPEDASINLVARWRGGDQLAANELFRRYAEQLIALARSRLSAKFSQGVDPEDVVQSAYRSFFHGTRDGRYDILRGGDLWQLLVVITLHKVQHQVRRNLAGKRSITREQPVVGDNGLLAIQAH